MARTFTYLFGGGATLLLFSLLLPHSPDRDTTALLVVSAGAYVSSAGFLALYDRLPGWVFQIAPAAGTLLVSLAVYFGGSNGADAYVMFYFWVAMAACYFLRPAGAFAHLALASAAYGVVLLLTPENVALPALKWVLLTGTLLVVGSLMTALREQVERLLQQLGSAARTDPVTGLANRRALDERFSAELERSTRTGRPLSILALDADWFKDFNDRYGHVAGRRALILIADALGARLGRATWSPGSAARTSPSWRRGRRAGGIPARRKAEDRSEERLRARAGALDGELRGGELPWARDHGRRARPRLRPCPVGGQGEGTKPLRRLQPPARPIAESDRRSS